MSTTAAYPSFLGNETNIIIFVSCTCGVLGLVLIFALIGFIWEQCSFVTKNKTLKKRRHKYLNNQTFVNERAHKNQQNEHGHDTDCENHYPTWLYNTMVHEQAQIMEAYLQDGSPKGPNHHDPEHYINSVFSDIFDENPKTGKAEKGIAYLRNNKMVTPEKKPAVPVPYDHLERNVTSKETKKNHTKISMENEKVERHKTETNSGFAIPLEDLDLDMFDMQEIDEPKEATKISIPKDMTVGERIKARQNNQTVEYENPRVLEKERRDRLREYEEYHEEHHEGKRVMLERSTSDLTFPKPEISKPAKLIGIPVSNKTALPTMEENQTQDSFLY